MDLDNKRNPRLTTKRTTRKQERTMSTHPTNKNNKNCDDNPEFNLRLSTDSIQLNAKNVLVFTENSNINDNTKQLSDTTAAPRTDCNKIHSGSEDVAYIDETNIAEEIFKTELLRETRNNRTEPNNNKSIQSNVSARRPGAHAVEGIHGYLLDQPTLTSEELIYSPVGINDDTPTLFTATLVSEESLHERQLVEKTHPAISAVPIEDPIKSCRQWCYILIAVATLFAGIGGAVVAAISSQQKNKSKESNFTPTTTPSLSLSPSQEPTYTPSFQPSGMMEGLFTIVALDLDTGLPAKNTSQLKALNWLLEQNAVVQYSTEELRQRYALATMIFSTESIPVTDEMSSHSHCTWPGIVCGTQEGINDKQVIGIDINFTVAAASYEKETRVTLPPELALLSNSITFLRFPE